MNVVFAGGVAAFAAVLTERSLAVVLVALVPALFVAQAVALSAHALAGTLVGLRIGEATIGAGPGVVTVGAGVPRVAVRLIPTYASVEAAVRGDPAKVRWRLAWVAFALAGPAALLAVVVTAAPYARSPALLALTVAAGFLLYLHVLLCVTRGRRGGFLWQAVSMLWRPAPVTADTPGGWAMTASEFWDGLEAARSAHRDGDFGPLLDGVVRLRAAFPDEPSYRCWEIQALADLGRYDDARARADEALMLEPPTPHSSHVQNMRAWVEALTGGDPAVMRTHVDAAFAALPDGADDAERAAVAGTAALVAAHESRWGDALALCDAADSGLTLPWQRATVEATRAFVAHRRGDHSAASAYAAAARRDDPRCPVLALLPGELQVRSTPPMP